MSIIFRFSFVWVLQWKKKRERALNWGNNIKQSISSGRWQSTAFTYYQHDESVDFKKYLALLHLIQIYGNAIAELLSTVHLSISSQTHTHTPVYYLWKFSILIQYLKWFASSILLMPSFIFAFACNPPNQNGAPICMCDRCSVWWLWFTFRIQHFEIQHILHKHINIHTHIYT